MPVVIQKAICFAILIGLHACAHVDEQWFLVNGASIQELDRHHELSKKFVTNDSPRLRYEEQEFIVTGHRLKGGEGMIIAFRSFDPGSFLLVDTASFLKITIFIPQPKSTSGMEIQIPNSQETIAFYSTSSSNFPGAGGCFGYASQGVIKINSVLETKTTVTLDLLFHLASPLGYSGECGEKRVQGTYAVTNLRLQELNPWQGVAGKNLYEETMAR